MHKKTQWLQFHKFDISTMLIVQVDSNFCFIFLPKEQHNLEKKAQIHLFATLNSWRSEFFLQRSSTDTSVHSAVPLRLHELFPQSKKSPSCLPQSSPDVLATISSIDLNLVKMLRLVTLPNLAPRWPPKSSPCGQPTCG